MKANLKGLSGIKGLLLLHGEKIGMVLVGLCAAYFVYSSLQLPRLPDEMQADKLRQTMSQTKSAVQEAKWPEPKDELAVNVRHYKPIAATGIGEVKPETFKISSDGWNSAVITPTVPRTDPVLLAALEVRATGGCGLFGFIDAEVQKARALAREAEAEKKLKEAEKQREKDLANPGQQGEGPGGKNRRGEGLDEFGMVEDKEHPGRKMLQSAVRPQGVQLQGDERIQKTYWAVVVAKVPIKEQLKLYRDSFENAKGGFDPATDFPRYFGFLVERAEVVRGQELKWGKVEVYDGLGKKIGPAMTPKYLETLYQTIATKWVPPQPEVVDDRYLDFEGVLAYPLPPLAWRDWGADVTHPDIPLAVNAPPREDETMPVEEQPKPPAGAPGADDIFTQTNPNAAMPGGPGFGGMSRGPGPGYGGRGGYGEMGGMPMRGGYEGRMGGGYGGGEATMMTMEKGAMMRGGGEMGMGGGRSFGFSRPGGNAGRTTLPRGVDSWLLRFFDFTVEPGKKYKYRVRLIAHDPNRKPGLDPETLDSKAQARIRDAIKDKSVGFRMANWSEPSPTVGIPLDGGVRMAEAKPANPEKFSDEPTAKLLVEAFGVDDKGNAIQASTDNKEFRRGAVANLVDKAEYLVEGGKYIDLIKSYRYHTGITVVDVTGGEKIGKDLQIPARVLLMDPTGQLYVRNEMDDHFEVELHRAIFNEDKKKGREGEFGPGGMMRDSEGRGGPVRGPGPGGRGGR